MFDCPYRPNRKSHDFFSCLTVKKQEVDDYNDFHVFHYYDDSMTLGIVGAVSKILGESFKESNV